MASTPPRGNSFDPKDNHSSRMPPLRSLSFASSLVGSLQPHVEEGCSSAKTSGSHNSPLSPRPARRPSGRPPSLSSSIDDLDQIDLEVLTSTLSPTAHALPRNSTLRMKRFDSALATPYGPELPMNLARAPYSDRMSYNYTFIPSIGQTWRKLAQELKSRLHIPYLPWWGLRGRDYFVHEVWHDAMAGLTCALLAIPESLSYMILASLAPVVGLHTAAIPPFAYALLGTSPHTSVGPISLVSLYLPSVFVALGLKIDDYSAAAHKARQEAGSVVAIYVCCLFGVMSLLRLGGLIRFLSHTVMTGFICASGVYVSIKELRHILHVPPPKEAFQYNYQVLVWIVRSFPRADPRTLALGGVSLLSLLTIKFLKRRFPATPERLRSRAFNCWYYLSSFSTPIVIFIGTLISKSLAEHGQAVPVLGSFPSGLVIPSFPPVARFPPSDLIKQALPIALLAYVEAVSIAKRYSALFGYKLDLNQDMASYSLANLLSALWGGVTPSGSFARTALQAEVGSRSSWANIFTGTFVIVCLYQTHILHDVPYCVLGALVVSAMVNLINFREFYHALRIARMSGLVMVFTFLVTLLWSVEHGLFYGIVASLALLLSQLSDVDAVILGEEPPRVDASGKRVAAHYPHLVSLRDNPRALPCNGGHGIIVLRPVASLFFGNAELLVSMMEKLLENEKGDARSRVAGTPPATAEALEQESPSQGPSREEDTCIPKPQHQSQDELEAQTKSNGTTGGAPPALENSVSSFST
ncbi:sulfate transporter [Nannochloropsis gaditana CCMP526]|uniref:sulfate transporter n=1 Tax=Nannochloropsis gaditana (strain CCMP526) TaxID=1093141 RepID=UPI00029F6A2C|nr:sulfate transporter [Nannochloropsis gaditana CCMP526]EKU21103.1 sulfate transporter [Nannochloropsis gaditana CCMP526]|eukprot:XP_005855259.1 sulfate transporter [Nannochloropsis gaditana CCMP526]